MKTKVEKLCDFVKEVFDLELDPETFRRVRAGYMQRSKGAWSWGIGIKSSGRSFGSQHSVTEILKMRDYVHLYKGGWSGDELIIENHRRLTPNRTFK